MRRYLISITAAIAVAASFLPSNAAGYAVNYGAIRGIEFSVKLAGGGTATGSLVQFDSVEFSASGTSRPNPATDHVYVGCLTVKTSVGTDGTCKVLPGAAVSLDPTLGTVTAAWSVDSKLQPGQRPPVRVYTTVIFTGTGAPALHEEPVVTRHSNTNVQLTEGPQIGRDGTVTGFVRSEGIVGSKKVGGGKIASTTSSTSWYGSGGSAHVYHP